jgi:hypothetical protein
MHPGVELNMFENLTSAIGLWFWQVRKIVFGRFEHLDPAEYFMLLLFGIVVGYLLLKGRA